MSLFSDFKPILLPAISYISLHMSELSWASSGSALNANYHNSSLISLFHLTKISKYLQLRIYCSVVVYHMNKYWNCHPLWTCSSKANQRIICNKGSSFRKWLGVFPGLFHKWSIWYLWTRCALVHIWCLLKFKDRARTWCQHSKSHALTIWWCFSYYREPWNGNPSYCWSSLFWGWSMYSHKVRCAMTMCYCMCTRKKM